MEEGKRTRLWALAEICYILDELPSSKDRKAVIAVLHAMATIEAPMLKVAGEKEAES